ncbi:hypothetical protein ACFC1R_38265 [Kitasatospora sp. NPDC056138]|uniref:hypothetical protein n=1 Tax=Kitasatospora sp. NPDC056138 TaxID=3345724 RepID=UPI0035E098FC
MHRWRRAYPGHTREDCQAGPDSGDIRSIRIGTAGTTEIWHTDQCPTYTIERILMEAGAEKAKEQDTKAKEAFPAVHSRLRDAATALPADAAVAPFVAALLELGRPRRAALTDERG